MTDNQPRYWFPAKRYGWGWGVPRTWQGWTVIIVYVVVISGAALLEDGWAKALSVISATLVLLLIGLRKGEPTRWRWGDR
jgi:hypothetical protein